MNHSILGRGLAKGAFSPLPDDSELPEDIRKVVSDLIRRIENRLSDAPYDDLVGRILGGEDALGGALEAGEPISVIPGEHKGACTRVALALARGGSLTSPTGFPRVMRAVRKYLIDCERITQTVVLLTDVWTPKQAEEHLLDVHAHARHGRFVIPHLVTAGRIVRIHWPAG